VRERERERKRGRERVRAPERDRRSEGGREREREIERERERERRVLTHNIGLRQKVRYTIISYFHMTYVGVCMLRFYATLKKTVVVY